MTKIASSPSPAAVDYDATLILSVETSNKTWVLATHMSGLGQVKAKQTIEPNVDALSTAIEGYRRRATASGAAVERVIVVYEAGYGGFWLARWLDAQGVEVHVVQPSSVPGNGVSAEQNRTRSTPTNIRDAVIASWDNASVSIFRGYRAPALTRKS